MTFRHFKETLVLAMIKMAKRILEKQYVKLEFIPMIVNTDKKCTIYIVQNLKKQIL